MTSTQKVIKYVSLAFAIFLIYIIFSAIFSGISMVSEAVNPKYNNNIEVIKGDKKELKDDIKSLKVKLSTTNFSIKAGDKLYIETNNDKIKNLIDITPLLSCANLFVLLFLRALSSAWRDVWRTLMREKPKTVQIQNTIRRSCPRHGVSAPPWISKPQ